MDPDANWAEQEEIRARLKIKRANAGDKARLRELEDALSEWINKGGFEPSAWKQEA